jgi:hypothetical protein
MKTKKIFSVILTTLAICATVMVASCKKDDITPSGQDTNPNLSNRGGLAFVIKNSAGDPVSGASVGIALSQSELVTNSYLASRISDSNGHADFGKWNPGNYYYEADVTIGSTSYHGEGVIQVQAGVDITQELTVH